MIIDEAHLCQAQRYKEIIAAFPDTVIVGLSASWIRLDRKGFTPPFTKLIKGPSIRELQDMGKLCKIETFVAELFDDTGIKTVQGDYNKTQVNERVDKPFVLSETVKHWEKHALGKKTLVFCASIKHADDMARQFSDSGYDAVSLSSANDAVEIRRTLERFYKGDFNILVSVDLFVMGFTVRDCECIIQARPTQSLMVYLQQVGRGTMQSPGKPYLINLDTCNNYSRHGLPDIDREWTLTPPPKKDKGESTLKRCPDCERPVLRVLMECPHCGHIWEKSLVVERKINEKEGILVAISRRNEAQALIRDIARNAKNIGDAMRIAAKPGYAIPGKEVYETARDIWERVLKNKKVLTH
jgi:superfamily II DNA or RNA helicase